MVKECARVNPNDNASLQNKSRDRTNHCSSSSRSWNEFPEFCCRQGLVSLVSLASGLGLLHCKVQTWHRNYVKTKAHFSNVGKFEKAFKPSRKLFNSVLCSIYRSVIKTPGPGKSTTLPTLTKSTNPSFLESRIRSSQHSPWKLQKILKRECCHKTDWIRQLS